MPSTKSTIYKKDEKKQAFLDAYALSGNITKSCEAVDIHRSTYYNWMEADESFAVGFSQADDRYNELMEAEADRRGIKGIEEPIFYKGAQIATIRRYSDTLLMFRMKGRMPEKYRDNQTVEYKGQLTIEHLLKEVDGKGIPEPGG